MLDIQHQFVNDLGCCTPLFSHFYVRRGTCGFWCPHIFIRDYYIIMTNPWIFFLFIKNLEGQNVLGLIVKYLLEVENEDVLFLHNKNWRISGYNFHCGKLRCMYWYWLIKTHFWNTWDLVVGLFILSTVVTGKGLSVGICLVGGPEMMDTGCNGNTPVTLHYYYHYYCVLKMII